MDSYRYLADYGKKRLKITKAEEKTGDRLNARRLKRTSGTRTGRQSAGEWSSQPFATLR